MKNSKIVISDNVNIPDSAYAGLRSYLRKHGTSEEYKVKDWDSSSNLLTLEDENSSRVVLGINSEDDSQVDLSMSLTFILFILLYYIGI